MVNNSSINRKLVFIEIDLLTFSQKYFIAFLGLLLCEKMKIEILQFVLNNNAFLPDKNEKYIQGDEVGGHC